MRVVFRTDASDRIGSGHLARCLTLAGVLAARGVDTAFVCREHQPGWYTGVADAGHVLMLLPRASNRPTAADGDYAASLGVSQQRDAAETLSVLVAAGSDLVVVDHYGLDSEWEQMVRPRSSHMMAIDDLANRPHEVDLLLDQNLRADGSFAYTDLVPSGCQVLSGPSYALVKAAYRRAREHRPAAVEQGRLLVSFGGIDDPALVTTTVRALGDLCEVAAGVDVVVAAPERVTAALDGQDLARLPLRVLGRQPDLAGLLGKADIAVGAGGGTTWERACVGVPSVVVSVAENQHRGLEAMSAIGAVEYLGPAAKVSRSSIAKVAGALLASPKRKQMMGELGRALVDGLGAQRVAEALLPSSRTSLRLRQALQGDCGTLWTWANDRTVRAQSLDPAPITWDEHVAWFARHIDDPTSRILILEVDGLPVGQVRFDLAGRRAIINYSLDVCVRGRGWGSELVERGLASLRLDEQAENTEVEAIVRWDNPASTAVFDKLGFDRSLTNRAGHTVLRFVKALHA